MTNTTNLSNDAQELLKIVPPSGRITNQPAMEKLAWNYEKLVVAKNELREAGLIDIKPGPGGSFGKIDTTIHNASLTDSSPRAEIESDLYQPFSEWTKGEFVPDDYDDDKDFFAVTISANKRPALAGKWEVPDLIAVSLKAYPYVPGVALEAVSFEVKKQADAFNPYGIFEAISHSKFVHRTFYCFEWLRDDFENDAGYKRIMQEAVTHGIGLLRLQFVDLSRKQLRVDELLEPRLKVPDASVLNSLIASFFDDQERRKISNRVH